MNKIPSKFCHGCMRQNVFFFSYDFIDFKIISSRAGRLWLIFFIVRVFFRAKIKMNRETYDFLNEMDNVEFDKKKL